MSPVLESEWSWWSDREQFGGALGAIGSHYTDLLSFITTTRVSRVKCSMRTIIAQKQDPAAAAGVTKAVTSDDTAEFRMQHQSHAAADSESSKQTGDASTAVAPPQSFHSSVTLMAAAYGVVRNELILLSDRGALVANMSNLEFTFTPADRQHPKGFAAAAASSSSSAAPSSASSSSSAPASLTPRVWTSDAPDVAESKILSPYTRGTVLLGQRLQAAIAQLKEAQTAASVSAASSSARLTDFPPALAGIDFPLSISTVVSSTRMSSDAPAQVVSMDPSSASSSSPPVVQPPAKSKQPNKTRPQQESGVASLEVASISASTYSLGGAPAAVLASAVSSSHLFDDLLRSTLVLGKDTLVCFDSSALLELYSWPKDRRTKLFNLFFPQDKAGAASSVKSAASSPVSPAVPVFICYYVMKEFFKNRPSVITKTAQALRDYTDGSNMPPLGVRASLGEAWTALQKTANTQAVEISKLSDPAQDDIWTFVSRAYESRTDQPFTWESECALRLYATQQLYPRKLGPGSDPRDSKDKDKDRPLDDQAGDFIIWQKLVHVVKDIQSPSKLLWVSNDGKADWWYGHDLTPYCRREFAHSNPQHTISPYKLLQFERVFITGERNAPEEPEPQDKSPIGLISVHDSMRGFLSDLQVAQIRDIVKPKGSDGGIKLGLTGPTGAPGAWMAPEMFPYTLQGPIIPVPSWQQYYHGSTGPNTSVPFGQPTSY